MVGDRERHARVAGEVAGLAGGGLREEHDAVALHAGPDRDGVRGAARAAPWRGGRSWGPRRAPGRRREARSPHHRPSEGAIGPDSLNARGYPPITRLVDLVLSPFARLLPSAEHVGVRRRRLAAAVAAVLLLALAAHIAYAVIGAGSSELADLLVNKVARQLTMVLRGDPVRAERAARRPGPRRLAGARDRARPVRGRPTRTGTPDPRPSAEAPPIPSLADAGWLAFYPFAYLCLGLHVRPHRPRRPGEHVARRPRRRARASRRSASRSCVGAARGPAPARAASSCRQRRLPDRRRRCCSPS